MAKRISVFIICLLCLLLGACEENKTNNVDWNIDAQYNTAYNDWSDFYSIYETETGIISYYHVSGSDPMFFPLFIDEGKVSYLNNNVSSTCSFANSAECDNLIMNTAPADGSSVFYYKGKVYYFDAVHDENWMYDDIYISSSDIDGTNQKREYLLGNYSSMKEEGSHTSYLQFHKNRIYAAFRNELFIINMDNGKIETPELLGVKDVWKLFLQDETMYLTTEEYNDGKKVYFNALLECDLDGNVKSIIEYDKIVLFVDDTIMYYASLNNDVYNFYIENRKNGDCIQLGEKNYQYALKYGETYLFDTGSVPNTSSEIMIMNKDNEIIHVKDYTNDKYVNETPLFIGDKYYVMTYLKDTLRKDWYGYYEISDDGISDLIEIPHID